MSKLRSQGEPNRENGGGFLPEGYQPLRRLLVRRVSLEVSVYALALSLLTSAVLVGFIYRFQTAQTKTWVGSFPQSVLPHLVESDYFSVQGKAKLLESTRLFTGLRIRDLRGNVIYQTPGLSPDTALDRRVNLTDAAQVTWGSFEYARNYSQLFQSLVVAGLLAFVGLLSLFLLLRNRLSSGRWLEIAPFVRFLGEVQTLSRRLAEKGTEGLRTALPRVATVPLSQEEAAMNQVIEKLLGEIEVRERLLVEQTERIERQKFTEELARSAAQVSHDIRSPLTALKLVQSSLGEVPEEMRILVREAIQRIEDIARSLEAKPQRAPAAVPASILPVPTAEKKTEVELLSVLLESIVAEKRLRLLGRGSSVDIREEYRDDAYGIFARVEPAEFQRAVSNLLDNAIEAMEPTGKAGTIVVRLERRDRACVLTIEDDGKGIPADVLGKVGARGATFGKPGGSGLGLHHAIGHFEQWGGELALDSRVGEGTRVTVTLPEASTPAWFLSRLFLSKGGDVVVLDDDPSIHRVWDARFQRLATDATGLRVHHFYRSADVDRWLSEHGSGDMRFLFDYELFGDPQSGLDLIEVRGLRDRASLVTSHFVDKEVRERCARLGVRILPKILADKVPIALE